MLQLSLQALVNPVTEDDPRLIRVPAAARERMGLEVVEESCALFLVNRAPRIEQKTERERERERERDRI